MRSLKKTFGVVIIAIVFINLSACKKTASAIISNGGSWTIKGSTYNADSSVYYSYGSGLPASMNAVTVLNPSHLAAYSQLAIFLGAPPTASGSYTLVTDSVFTNGMLNSNQAYVYVVLGAATGAEYEATGIGAIGVTVSPSGKISIGSSSGIEVQSIINFSDSAKLIFNVTQTN